MRGEEEASKTKKERKKKEKSSIYTYKRALKCDSVRSNIPKLIRTTVYLSLHLHYSKRSTFLHRALCEPPFAFEQLPN